MIVTPAGNRESSRDVEEDSGSRLVSMWDGPTRSGLTKSKGDIYDQRGKNCQISRLGLEHKRGRRERNGDQLCSLYGRACGGGHGNAANYCKGRIKEARGAPGFETSRSTSTPRKKSARMRGSSLRRGK